jgi:hypothetical protein
MMCLTPTNSHNLHNKCIWRAWHIAIRRSNTVTKAMGDRLGKHRDSEFVGDSSLQTGERCEQLRQAVVGSPPWRIFVVGRTSINRRGANCIHHRPSIKWREAHKYLDDKTKEKALTEEMKKTYGT